jgi:ABC-type transport system involved in multi-copper enzyme maturation permease subunit
MMKYLAILKDSLRETIDTKLFYVMVALSSLLIVFIASVSFRPLTMDQELQAGIRQLNWVLSLQSPQQADKEKIRFEITDVRQLNQAAEPWLGDYRFNLTMHLPGDPGASKASAVQISKLIRALRGAAGLSSGPAKQLLQARFPWLDNLTVTEGQALKRTEEVYVVTTAGTKITSRFHWPHEPSLFFGAVPLPFFDQSLGRAVYFVENTLVNGFGAWTAILAGIVVTAFFIPNMLRKGAVELLLVKPIHRTTLLIFKYLGGLSFVFLNSAFVVFGIWLALGVRSGIWATGFLLSIFILTFFFALLYAVSALFGVWTRSAILAILMTGVAWFGLWLVGFLQSSLEALQRQEVRDQEIVMQEGPGAGRSFHFTVPGWVYTTVKTVHSVLPRTEDLDRLTTRLLSQELLTADEIRQLDMDHTLAISWGESLSVSSIFIAALLGLACWRFALKDY